MTISLPLQLKNVHEQLLVAMQATGQSNQDSIRLAARILNGSDFNYLTLLGQISTLRTKSGGAWAREQSLPFPNEPTAEAVKDGLAVLQALDLVNLGSVNDYGSTGYKLTEEGTRIAQQVLNGRHLTLRPPRLQRTKVFIALAFGRADVDALFASELVPACKAAGLETVRVDINEPRQTITSEILNGINAACCVIADLTFARQSVYFEVGYAHGLGIPLLLTCRTDHFKGAGDDVKVHFDLEQYKISYWKQNEDREFFWPSRMSPAERLPQVLKHPPNAA